MWADRLDSIDELALARSLSSQPGFAWLDSNRTESHDGRFSFLAAWPVEEVRTPFGSDSPFDSLGSLELPIEERPEGGPAPSEVPRWVGYVAYDAFWSAPPRGQPRFERGAEPILLFRRYPAPYRPGSGRRFREAC